MPALAACAAWVCTAWACAMPAAWGQGVLPATGVGGSPEDLRGNLEQFLPNAQQPSIERAWTVQPSIGVDLGVTDNPGGASSGKRVDAFVIVSPSLYLQGDTSRATVRLNYSPQVYRYLDTPSQNYVSQSFAGNALLTVVRDTAFIDVRGLVSQQSRFGAGNSAVFGQQNTQFYGSQGAVQTASFSVTPYVQHRFGGWGTGKVGYSYVRTFQDAADGPNTVFAPNSTQGYGNLGNLTTQRQRASFVTGENFGRFNSSTTLEATQYGGNGVYNDAHRNEVNNEFGYAVTRTITVLAGIGYQDLKYGGTPGYRVNEATYNGGLRLTPNADSSVTVLYGRRDGSAQLSFDGSYAPTARTRIFGRYSTGVTTSAEDQQTVLDTTSVGAGGLLVDTVTGAPVSSTSPFGIQNSLARVRRLSLTGLLLLDRDSFSASIQNDDQTTLTNSTSFLGNVVPPGTHSNNTIGTLSWQHQIDPVTNLTSSFSYGILDNGALLGGPSSGSQTLVTVSTGVSRSFTETLSGRITYTYSQRSGGSGNNIPANFGGNSTQNTLLAGVRKSF